MKDKKFVVKVLKIMIWIKYVIEFNFPCDGEKC
jgi:hypothetical protein